MTDQNVTIEGSDGARVTLAVGDALAAGLVSQAEADELRGRDLIAELFGEYARVGVPVGHLPGAVSADERARRRAEDEAALQEAEGRPELYRG